MGKYRVEGIGFDALKVKERCWVITTKAYKGVRYPVSEHIITPNSRIHEILREWDELYLASHQSEQRPHIEPPATEEWRVMPGYPNYVISNWGRVMRYTNGRGARAGRIRKLFPSRQGYVAVRLWDDIAEQTVPVHHKVAEAFIGPRPLGMEINHIDGNKSNNAVTNLEYVLPRDNAHHAINIGLVKNWGENNDHHKLTEEQVREILKLKGKLSSYKIAAMFGVGKTIINNIHCGKKWKRVYQEVINEAT